MISIKLSIEQVINGVPNLSLFSRDYLNSEDFMTSLYIIFVLLTFVLANLILDVNLNESRRTVIICSFIGVLILTTTYSLNQYQSKALNEWQNSYLTEYVLQQDETIEDTELVKSVDLFRDVAFLEVKVDNRIKSYEGIVRVDEEIEEVLIKKQVLDVDIPVGKFRTLNKDTFAVYTVSVPKEVYVNLTYEFME